MAQRNLDAARQFIKEKRYKQARAVLNTSSSKEARALLRHIDELERTERPVSIFRLPYLFMLLIGMALPVVVAIVLVLLSGQSGAGGLVLVQGATQTPSITISPTKTATASVTPSRTPSQTPTATMTLAPTATPSPTRMLPASWTPTDIQVFATPNRTATALAEFVATGEAFVAATQTVTVRRSFTGADQDEPLGVVGTPDEACQSAARVWWRQARLVAADTFSTLVDDQDEILALIDTQPDLGASLGDSVEFMQSLHDELAVLEYPPCANTAQELALAFMQFRILVAQSAAIGDQDLYEASLEQANTYKRFLDRELDILGVQRN